MSFFIPKNAVVNISKNAATQRMKTLSKSTAFPTFTPLRIPFKPTAPTTTQHRFMAKRKSKDEYDEYVEMLHKAKKTQELSSNDIKTRDIMQNHHNMMRQRELEVFRNTSEIQLPTRFLMFGGTIVCTLFLASEMWEYHVDYYGEGPDIPVVKNLITPKYGKNPDVDITSITRESDLAVEEVTQAPPHVYLPIKERPNF